MSKEYKFCGKSHFSTYILIYLTSTLLIVHKTYFVRLYILWMALACRFSHAISAHMSKVGQVYIILSKAVHTTFAYTLYNLSSRIITMFSICPKSIIIVICYGYGYMVMVYTEREHWKLTRTCCDKILYILHMRLMYANFAFITTNMYRQ